MKLFLTDYSKLEEIVPLMPAGWIPILCHVVYEQAIWVNGTWDEGKVNAFLDGIPPLSFYSWDVESNGAAIKNMDTAERDKMKALLDHGHERRPDCFGNNYGWGTHPYWLDPVPPSTAVKDWATASQAQKDVELEDWEEIWPDMLSHCRWVAPTVYDKYETSLPGEKAWCDASVRSCVTNDPTKLVVPYAWGRRFDVLLSAQEILDVQVLPALAAGAHGIMAWIGTASGAEADARMKAFVPLLPPQPLPSWPEPPEPVEPPPEEDHVPPGQAKPPKPPKDHPPQGHGKPPPPAR